MIFLLPFENPTKRIFLSTTSSPNVGASLILFYYRVQLFVLLVSNLRARFPTVGAVQVPARDDGLLYF